MTAAILGYEGRKRCDCPAWDPIHNAHTEAEHTDCGGGLTPEHVCGGCDSCMSHQIAYWRNRTTADPEQLRERLGVTAADVAEEAWDEKSRLEEEARYEARRDD